MVKLIAIKSHSPDGSIRYRAGTSYEISEKAARILIATGFARLDTAQPVKDKQAYRHRKLEAED